MRPSNSLFCPVKQTRRVSLMNGEICVAEGNDIRYPKFTENQIRGFTWRVTRIFTMFVVGL
jgi:hypothetical protein